MLNQKFEIFLIQHLDSIKILLSELWTIPMEKHWFIWTVVWNKATATTTTKNWNLVNGKYKAKLLFHIFLGLKTIELLAKLGSSHGFYTIFIFIFILLHFILLTNPKHDLQFSNCNKIKKASSKFSSRKQ